MKPFTAPIQNAYGWNAHSHHLKPMLGIDAKKKLPPEGMPAREIQGVKVYVLSLKEAAERKVFHRARAICPKCGTDLSAGRLHQHKCA